MISVKPSIPSKSLSKDIKKGRLGSGSSLFATLIHEAGHGIGLSHPHDSGLGGSMSGVYPGLVSGDAFGEFGTGLWGLTQTPYTIMTYKRGYTNQFIDQSYEKAKSFALASCGGDTPETYQKLTKQEGGEPDWEEIANQIALGHELASQPSRKKGRE